VPKDRALNTYEQHGHANAEIWRLWKERGVSDQTELAVDFRFYTSRQRNAELLIEALKKAGFVVQHLRRRTFLIFRGHEVIGTARARWTLPLLQDRSREFVELANELDLLYEGFGAELP